MTTEIKFTLILPDVPEIHHIEAENKAKEAYVMTLLRHGDISAGCAAELLEIDRYRLSDLMDHYNISCFPLQSQEELQQQVTETLQILEEDLAKDMKNIEQLDNDQNISQTSLGFGEFIQKFRQEHNLAQEGIEPEELLKEVRDLSSGREVILN